MRPGAEGGLRIIAYRQAGSKGAPFSGFKYEKGV